VSSVAPAWRATATSACSSDEEGTVTTVLVADDDPDIRELVELKLSSAGYDVLTVADGRAALDALLTRPLDLAVLDVMMPVLSGTDVLRALRDRTSDSAPAVWPTKVILLTAKAQEADVEAGFALGADDYVVKPFSPRELLSRVQAVLGRVPG
jgi:DNA-binding response OmpR family regulator